MENNEEVLEEIEDINENNSTDVDVKVDKMIDEAMDDTAANNNTPEVNNTINNDINNGATNVAGAASTPDVSVDANAAPDNQNNVEELQVPKKSKLPIIIILSVLLLLDIIALAIYLIGIDKVFGIVK